MTRRLPLLALLAATLLAGPVPGAAARTDAPTPDEILRRLPAVADGWMLTGEIDAASFPLYLDTATVARGGRLVLGLETAVAVMPEASSLAIQVNGRTVGQVALGGADARRVVTVPVPPAALVTGWNRIRLVANQRHRVDCSIDATYELWTRIDPAVSGFVAAAPAQPPSGLDTLGTLSLDADGRLPIRIRAAAGDPRLLATAFAVAAAAARAAGSTDPVVDVADAAGTGAGLDVAAGPPAALAALGIDAALVTPGEPKLLPGDGTRRPLLVVAARSPEDAVPALRRLADALPPVPADGIVRVDGDSPRTISLAEFGVRHEQFGGRLWSRTLRLALPADAVTADYAAVALRLDAGYAPDLSADDEFGVYVNDKLAATVAFGKVSGDVTEGRRVDLPLSVFRPGVNTVRLEARLVSPDDAECDPHRQISAPPRFLVLDTTTVTVPRLARMARLPDLGATLGTGRAGADPAAPVRLAVASADVATLSAAATLYARMAVAAPQLPGLALTLAPDAAPAPGTILIGAAPDLAPARFRQAGLEPPTEGHGWTHPDGPQAIDSLVTGTIAAAGGETAPLLDAWRSRVRSGDGLADSLRGRVSALLADAVAFAGLGAPSSDVVIPADARLAVAQTLVGDADEPVTLVSGPSRQALADAVARLGDPGRWAQLSGRVALVDETDGLTTVAADRTRLVATVPFDPINLRLVASAWLSANTAVYGLLLLGAGTLFGLTTYAKVRRSGVRRS